MSDSSGSDPSSSSPERSVSRHASASVASQSIADKEQLVKQVTELMQQRLWAEIPHIAEEVVVRCLRSNVGQAKSSDRPPPPKVETVENSPDQSPSVSPTRSGKVLERKDSHMTGTPKVADDEDDDKRSSTATAGKKKTAQAETSVEATTLEKAWQPLFDHSGPTRRLGQFLRGIALHLTEDYGPQGSMFVTPDLMFWFFEQATIANDPFPWRTVFGSEISNNSLSRMYQKLLCQMVLVQAQKHEQPSVPGLTPHGFEQFMICLIQAFPQEEYERLSWAVKSMPISNADNRSDRFPKELPRRLLPAQRDLRSLQRLVASLDHEPLVSFMGISMPPPPALNERERAPYSSNAQREEASVPSERERKPYSSNVYRSPSPEMPRASRQATGQYRSEDNHPWENRSPGGQQRQTRTGTSQSYGDASRSQRKPTSSQQQTSTSNMNKSRTRLDAPVTSSTTSRGEGASYSSRTPAARDSYDDDDRYVRRESMRPSHVYGDDEHVGRSYPAPPRPPPSIQALEVPGTYVRRDSRRDIWPSSPGSQGPGGTDGYGSYSQHHAL